VDGASCWNEALAGTFATYLGGTISIAVRNAVVSGLIAAYADQGRTVLDIGCAAGSLSRALASSRVEHYVGVDISDYAVRRAIEERDAAPERFVKTSEFVAADLRIYAVPRDSHPDVIAFNEVLYYLDPGEAEAQVRRYAQSAAGGALIVVSMKNDAKSHVILEKLCRTLEWVDGVLWQEKPEGYSYRVTINRERPAYLIGLFRMRRSTVQAGEE
jgi:predicted TPR repeat methyltransferase